MDRVLCVLLNLEIYFPVSSYVDYSFLNIKIGSAIQMILSQWQLR